MIGLLLGHTMLANEARYIVIKRSLHWIGGGLGIGGILFVFQRLLNAVEKIGSERLLQISGAGLFFLVAVYAVSNIPLVLAWRELLLFSGEPRVERTQAIRIYALSQLAKYVPGNVFHLAGRQALGVAAGFSGKALMKALFGELALISLVALYFVFFTLPALSLNVSFTQALALFGVSFCLTLLLVGRFMNARVVRAFLLQFIFLGVSGYIFIRCLGLLGTEVVSDDFFVTLGAYVVAWLVGLVTPGAPAGLGVREAVLLFFLGGRIEETPLLLATVLARVVSIFGDVLFYAYGALETVISRQK